MSTRIITALVSIAVFAAIVGADFIVLQIALAIVVFAMLYECNHVMTKSLSAKAATYIAASLILTGMALNDFVITWLHS